MLHFIKRFWLAMALMLAGGQSMFGFALYGPYEFYQVPTIGYNLSPPASTFYNDGGNTDPGGPKNIGQGYRWNSPTNYYAFDPAFDSYFGTQAEAAVDAAFAMYNNLTNASNLNLDDWPDYATRVNFRAQALQLLDIKSFTMSLIIEQLGLAQPDRWTWCLHGRDTINLTCPNYNYFVIQRNYDPYTDLYSSYVNGILYGYQIVELCGVANNHYAPLEADAIEVPVDPTQQGETGSSVAALGTGQIYGSFFTTFTRDDIGGLKYLYSATNAYAEQAPPGSIQLVTNKSSQVELVTSNLAVFYQQSLTNNDAALLALYPGLVILSTSNTFGLLVTTNVTAYVTNPPFAPAGSVLLVLATNYSTNVQTLYHRTFANLQVLHSYSQGYVSQQTVKVVPKPFAPAGTVYTNIVTTTSLVNFTNGDFYILPTNLCGPYVIVSNIFVNVVAITNVLPLVTNLPAGFTNTSQTNFLSTSIINYFTNYYLAAYEVDCGTNAAAVRGGMEKITFLRREYDAVLNQLVTPITNTFHLTAITNGSPVVQTFKRIVTQPDIIISAQDLASGPGGPLNDNSALFTQLQYNTNLVQPGQGGPGTLISTGIKFTFNSVGPIYYNAANGFTAGTITQSTARPVFQWGSFDGTTNDPIVYPNTMSIAEREAALYYQITTATLPDASVSGNAPGNPYVSTLEASGSALTQPYTWTLVGGGLPPGLTLTSDGTISGSPQATGTYDFTVQLTDGTGKIAQKDLFIVVNP